MQTYVKNGNDILKMKQINWRTAIEIETNIINSNII